MIEVAGSPRERGRAHGEVLSDAIGTLLSEFFDHVERTSRSHGVEPMPRERTLAIASTYVEPAECYAPDLVEEARGIAEGADVPFDQIFALNAFLDLFDHLSPAFVGAGCTSMMVPGGLDGEGALIAQNYDLPTIFAPAAVLMRITGDDGPDTLVYTSAGMIGCAGLNAAGIGVVINNLVPSDARSGVPHPFVVRRILSTEGIGDAIGAVVTARRASGTNYVLCDRHGEIYSLEASAADYEVFCPFDGPLAHSNHYLADRLKPLDRRAWAERGQSIARWGRATRLLLASKRLDEDALKGMLCDHVNEPIGICRHNELHEGESCGQTICGIVLSPPERRAWFARGPSCENEWVEYCLCEEPAAEAPRLGFE